jgi:hypothetical protein
MRNPQSLRTAVLPLVLSLVLALPGARVSAQTVPEADPADVESLDAIIAALYDVISGPAGEARDWDRFRSLFIEGARLIPVGRTPEGGIRHLVWSPEEYLAQAGASLEQNGFFEDEIGRTTEQFGMITHAFSAYQSKRTASDPEPFARGINSIQVMHDGARYWIVSIFWDSERPGNPIPSKYIGR